MIKPLIAILLMFSLSVKVSAQDNFQTGYVFPVKIPIYLSGTFGELRPDHFHAGIDIRTESRTGKVIVAIEDGFVSRIKISATGYGKALYIDHPDGYTSVYGHLWHFNDDLDSYVKSVQFSQKSFEVDVFPEAGRFTFRKGDTLGFSGNTGSSGGPHLHFELRETSGQIPVNPLLNGFSIEDVTPPVINLIKIYPKDGNAFINGKNREVKVFTQNAGAGYIPAANQPFHISGDVYFGINTWDPFNNNNNKNGVYSIEYYLDSLLYFKQAFDKVSFDETRYINSLIDYQELKRKKTGIQKTFIQPGNRLGIYQKVTDSGLFHFRDSLVHTVAVRVSDANGNVACLDFRVKSAPPEAGVNDSLPSSDSSGLFIFRFDRENLFDTTGFRFSAPDFALYEDIQVNYRVSPRRNGMLSPTHSIHNHFVPLHKYCELSVKPDSISRELQSKALIVRFTDKDIEAFTGEWQNGYLTCKTRRFGDYALTVDTLVPDLRSISGNPAHTHPGDTIRLTAKDNFSGIGAYNAFLNGEWVLLEYDLKDNMVYYVADENLKQGNNRLQVIIEDRVKNRTQKELTVILE
ncbi:MAG: M23 family metallopeptidase [Bacteroidales bacterium]|nr:M23 family metallopeptidase [Bacteroidales bacterium]